MRGMSNKQAQAVIAGVAAGLTATGGGIAAIGSMTGNAWVQAAGVLLALGAGLGAGLAAYRSAQ